MEEMSRDIDYLSRDGAAKLEFEDHRRKSEYRIQPPTLFQEELLRMLKPSVWVDPEELPEEFFLPDGRMQDPTLYHNLKEEKKC